MLPHVQDATFWRYLAIATQTAEERKEALNRRTLGNRANITVCIHNINMHYCVPCNTKKVSVKTKKAKKSDAKTPEAPLRRNNRLFRISPHILFLWSRLGRIDPSGFFTSRHSSRSSLFNEN